MKKINNPHDKFFREVLSERENAIDFVKGVFPKNLKDLIDFDTFEYESTSYVNGTLKEYFSDVVYNCKLKDTQIKVSLLFEHKSYHVAEPHFQLLRYMIEIWEHQRKQRIDPVPVIPVIFYHHEATWKMRSMTEFFGEIPPEIKPFIPHFEYLLVDVTRYSDDEVENSLFRQKQLVFMAGVMKHILGDDHLDEYLRHLWLKEADFLHTAAGVGFLKTISLYLINSGNESVSDNDIISLVGQVSQKVKDEVMTIAEKWKVEGMTLQNLKTVEKMLEESFAWEVITKITGFTESEYKAFKS
jgi:predicted transposase/invertase (TIGR01784 family)